MNLHLTRNSRWALSGIAALALGLLVACGGGDDTTTLTAEQAQQVADAALFVIGDLPAGDWEQDEEQASIDQLLPTGGDLNADLDVPAAIVRVLLVSNHGEQAHDVAVQLQPYREPTDSDGWRGEDDGAPPRRARRGRAGARAQGNPPKPSFRRSPSERIFLGALRRWLTRGDKGRRTNRHPPRNPSSAASGRSRWRWRRPRAW